MARTLLTSCPRWAANSPGLVTLRIWYCLTASSELRHHLESCTARENSSVDQFPAAALVRILRSSGLELASWPTNPYCLSASATDGIYDPPQYQWWVSQNRRALDALPYRSLM